MVKKVRKPAALTNRRAVQLLDRLVTALNQQGKASEDLWNIVTALRGPDNDHNHLKELTTQRIRAAIGLREGFTGGVFLARPSALSTDEIATRNRYFETDELIEHHFKVHYYRAVDAISRLYGYDVATEIKQEKK
jgi:hypothetical protein